MTYRYWESELPSRYCEPGCEELDNEELFDEDGREFPELEPEETFEEDERPFY